MTTLIEQLPRFGYIAFSLYGLFVLMARWQVSRVLTMDRRFLFLFFALELCNTSLSGVLKITHDTPVDVSAWLTVLTQSFLAAYLYYSIPSQYRRAHHRWTRRPSTEV